MRLYICPMEMIKEVERDLYEMGTRYQSSTVQDQDVSNDPKFKTIELTGYGYLLFFNDSFYEKRNEFLRYTGYSDERINWVYAEMMERLGYTHPKYSNPGEAWEHDYKFWGQFIRNGFFSYSYRERWLEQLPYVIEELCRNPNSRQVIMTMYDRHQDIMNWGGLDRVPCSVSYQFLIREEKLMLVYNQRSCDFIKFFAADVFLSMMLMSYVSTKVGIEPGGLIHFLGSLHAFAGDMKEGIF